MSARYITLPFAATAFGDVTTHADGRPATIVVSNGQVSVTVDLATGLATPTAGKVQRARVDPSSQLGGLIERQRETNEGPRLELLEGDRVLASIAGDVYDATRTGDLVVVSTCIPVQRWDTAAIVLGAGAPAMHLPGAFPAALASERGGAIAATGALVHAFRADAGRVSALTFAMPSAARTDARIIGGEALVLAGTSLLSFSLGSLPFRAGEHHAIAVSYAPVVGAARGLRVPGVVAALVGAKVLVDHPDVRRVTIERQPTDPAVKVGDRIVIDDVREPLPGILKVHAWHVEGRGAPSVRPPPPPLTAEAPAVAPLAVAPSLPRERPRNAETMRATCARWGVPVPAALDAFLSATDEDAVLCRWLARIGLESIEVRTLTADWNADPCLVALAGRGNGDEIALYFYPPALARGEEPRVVEFAHETNEAIDLAHDFAALWNVLFRTADQLDPFVAARLRERFAVHARELGSPTPPWLAPEGVRATPLAEIESWMARGELLSAERAWLVHYLRGGAHGQRAKDELLRLYAQLGWSAAHDALSESGG